MHRAPTLSHPRGLPLAKTHVLSRWLGIGLLAVGLTGLAKPLSASVLNDCTALLTTPMAPAERRSVIVERSLSINGMNTCIHGYHTDWAPTEVLEHYRREWTQRGRQQRPFTLRQTHPTSLMARLGAHHYRVQALANGSGTVVSVSRIDADAREPAANNQPNTPAHGFEVFYRQTNQAGHSLGLTSDKAQPAAMIQLLGHYQRLGWQLEARQPPSSAILSRGGRLLNLTLQSELGQTQALLEFINADARDDD